jgi:uncharacterized membrane protein
MSVVNEVDPMRFAFIKIVAVLLLCLPATSMAKTYGIEKIAIDAEVKSDGSFHISEEITYGFSGRFRFAFREMPLAADESISDIRVDEGRLVYVRSSSDEPSTFEVIEQRGRVTIKWYYHARNERRTFRISYTLHGVVKRYPDVAELYHKFVGEEWDLRIGEVTVNLRLPDGAERSRLQAWVHGPVLLNGTVTINDDGSVSMNVAPLPRRAYWEGRVLFASDALSGVRMSADTPRRQTVVEEEREWVEDANRRREARIASLEADRARRDSLQKRARTYLPLSIVIAIAGLGFWFAAFRRHGWPHEVRSLTARGEIPSDHRPAVVSYLMNRNVGGPAIVATLIDLADRGYFNIHETLREKKTLFGRRKEIDYRFERTDKLWKDLESYELELAEFLITEVGDVTGFSMSGLRKTASKSRGKFLKWFRQWIKSVKKVGETFSFYEPYPTRAMVGNVAVGLGMIALGGFFCLYSSSPAGVPAIAGGVIVAILTAALNRRTADGRRLMLAWRDFREHLKKISKALGPVSLHSHEWSRYLGVAIIFGMHKKLLPKLTQVDNDGAGTTPVWYYGALGGSGDGLTSLADGLTTMVNTVSTTVSSASGAGGGASVGGGGGSGGGGGGAG